MSEYLDNGCYGRSRTHKCGMQKQSVHSDALLLAVDVL